MNTPKSLTLLVAVMAGLVAAALALASRAGAAQAARPAEDTDPASTHKLFLPVVAKSPPMLYGRVTEGGASAAGVPVNLRLFNGASWSTAATAFTDAGGYYRFTNVPGLGPGQKYQATFENTNGHDGRLAWWGTRELASYAAANSVHLGDFDLSAITLNEPGHDWTVPLPATFRWTRRGASASDSYALRLYDGGDLNPMYVSAFSGYVDSHTLNGLPAGFSANTAYTWDVVVRSPDGGQGVSRQARTVKMNNGLYGRVTQNGAAAGGVALQLRHFNGSWWSTAATTTTNSDGTFTFGSVPTLGKGQKYYVRYENVTQTPGRLFLWSTRTLTAYTNGAAVHIGDFDIADLTLVSPPGGATVGVPYLFQWTRRPATTNDSYLMEIYDPADYQPRWLSPLLGYAEGYMLQGLSPVLNTNTLYAWDVIITSPDGGSGVSRAARLVRFSNRGSSFESTAGEFPFDEELPARPAESYEGGE